MSLTPCCVQGFKWDGTPEGKETTLAKVKTYVTGSNPDVAVLVIHDVFGWTFPNLRLLADHYAREANATVYLPDFFDGEVLDAEILKGDQVFDKVDFPSFLKRHSKEIREPEMVACVQALRSEHKFQRIGAIGFCYGGWAVLRLGSKQANNPNPFVDCISMAHPSLVTHEEIDNVAVPVQILAPEIDPAFSPELKEYTNKVIPTLGVPYDYQLFPGLVHAFATRGKESDPAERRGMARAKNAAVNWFNEWLHLH